MAENFWKLERDIDIQICKVNRSPEFQFKMIFSVYIILKLYKSKTKNIKSSKRKKSLTQGNYYKATSRFLIMTLQARREWDTKC